MIYNRGDLFKMKNESFGSKYFLRFIAAWMTAAIIWIVNADYFEGFDTIAYIGMGVVYLGAAWEFYRVKRDENKEEIDNLKYEINELKKKTIKKK